MVQHQREDLHHLPVAARAFEQHGLQPAQPLGQLGERGTVAQCTGLALQHRQVMTPIVDGAHRLIVTAGELAVVLGDDLALSGDHHPLGVGAQAHGTVGE